MESRVAFSIFRERASAGSYSVCGPYRAPRRSSSWEESRSRDDILVSSPRGEQLLLSKQKLSSFLWCARSRVFLSLGCTVIRRIASYKFRGVTNCQASTPNLRLPFLYITAVCILCSVIVLLDVRRASVTKVSFQKTICKHYEDRYFLYMVKLL